VPFFYVLFYKPLSGLLTQIPQARRMEQVLRFLTAGRYGEAVAAARALLADSQVPMDPDLHTLYGLALGGSGDLPAAVAELSKVARLRPDEPHPCLDLLPILRGAGRDRDIAPCLLATLAATPRAPLVALALARHYRESGEVRQALDLARHAVTLSPGFAEGHRLLAWVLADLGDLAASAVHSGRAVTLDPDDAAAWSNLGVALTDLGRHAEGEDAHREALRLAPEQPRVRVNRAVNLLAQGRLAEAWPDYEWRLRLPGHTALPIDRLLPDLASGVCLRGKTILITHEDGFGDTIQFARFAPLLADLGARVLAHAPAALERLFQTLDPRITVLPSSAALPIFDYHCPYTSLPRAFGVSLTSIPAAPYLFADPANAARWRDQSPRIDRKIGLVWAGQARPWLEGYGALDGRRSMRLEDLAPLATVPGICWVSLQKGPAAEEIAAASEFRRQHTAIWHPMKQVQDFADTAAIIDGLDAVISVDTSVAHLAGAMGKPVFLLDRFDTCWRWLRERSDNPWYPSLTIFRQQKLGDWTGPIALIRQILSS